MDPLWEQIARVLIAAAPAVVALAGLVRGPGRLRGRLRHDVELVEKLPEASSAREVLLRGITAQIEHIQESEHNASRDVPMLVVALISTPALGYLTLWLVQRGTWWGVALAIISGTFALVFAYGIFESAERVPRDNKRRRTKT